MTSNLSHSPADVVRWLMIQGGQGSDPSLSPKQPWPVNVGVEPSSPDEVITIADTTGQSDGRDMDSGVINEHRGLQFRFRSTDAVDGWGKASVVRAWLSQSVLEASVTVTAGGVVASYVVACLTKFSQVLKLGFDAPSTKRWLHTLNCTASIRQVS